MKVSVFNRTTGKFIAYGPRNSGPVERAISDGHHAVEIIADNSKMWDFSSSQLVDDPDYIARQQAKAQKRQNYSDAKSTIEGLTGSFKQGNQLNVDKVDSALQELVKLLQNT